MGVSRGGGGKCDWVFGAVHDVCWCVTCGAIAKRHWYHGCLRVGYCVFYLWVVWNGALGYRPMIYLIIGPLIGQWYLWCSNNIWLYVVLNISRVYVSDYELCIIMICFPTYTQLIMSNYFMAYVYNRHRGKKLSHSSDICQKIKPFKQIVVCSIFNMFMTPI